MSKKITCSGCSTYLGEIRDAKLKKDMVCLCSDCEIKRWAAYKYMSTMGEKDDRPYGDLFDGFLRGKR